MKFNSLANITSISCSCIEIPKKSQKTYKITGRDVKDILRGLQLHKGYFDLQGGQLY